MGHDVSATVAEVVEYRVLLLRMQAVYYAVGLYSVIDAIMKHAF